MALILPGAFIMVIPNLWYIAQFHIFFVIILMIIVYVGSPGLYILIAHLIMSRMERNSLKSKTKKGDILTLFGTNDKP